MLLYLYLDELENSYVLKLIVLNVGFNSRTHSELYTHKDFGSSCYSIVQVAYSPLLKFKIDCNYVPRQDSRLEFNVRIM